MRNTLRVALLAAILGILSMPVASADTNVCPGQCQGTECHNCTGCTCPQACTQTPTTCKPWIHCICEPGIPLDHWAAHSDEAPTHPVLHSEYSIEGHMSDKYTWAHRDLR